MEVLPHKGTFMWHARLIGPLALVLLISNGCGRSSPEAASKSKAPALAEAGGNGDSEHDDHDHGGGPHGGVISDWGDGDYHVEFTVDHDRREATVHVMGSDAKTPSPIAVESLLLSIEQPLFQLQLSPQPIEGEPDGASSRFVGRDDRLGVVQEFAGTISAKVAGVPYAGDFDESAAGHEHAH